MSKKKEKKKWKFLWKNVNGLGRLNRMGIGGLLIFASAKMKEDPPMSALLGAAGVYLIVVGLLRWCSLRAVLKRPTKRAYLRHYPKG